MGKKGSERPERDGSSDVTRKTLDGSPVRRLRIVLDRDNLLGMLPSRLSNERIAARTGPPELPPMWIFETLSRLLDFLPEDFRRPTEELTRGVAEAAIIRSHLERYAIESLRDYLREHPASPECLMWLLSENRRLARALAASETARKAARLKNAAPREFVVAEWKRADKGQSKASFGRVMAPLVRKRFGVSVTPERIARHWLKDD